MFGQGSQPQFIDPNFSRPPIYNPYSPQHHLIQQYQYQHQHQQPPPGPHFIYQSQPHQPHSSQHHPPANVPIGLPTIFTNPNIYQFPSYQDVRTPDATTNITGNAVNPNLMNAPMNQPVAAGIPLSAANLRHHQQQLLMASNAAAVAAMMGQSAPNLSQPQQHPIQRAPEHALYQRNAPAPTVMQPMHQPSPPQYSPHQQQSIHQNQQAMQQSIPKQLHPSLQPPPQSVQPRIMPLPFQHQPLNMSQPSPSRHPSYMPPLPPGYKPSPAFVPGVTSDPLISPAPVAATAPQTTCQPPANGPNRSVVSGLSRLLQYSEFLTPPAQHKTSIQYWRMFVTEFYSENGILKYSPWNATHRQIRTFEMGPAILPRYFQVNFESGVGHIQVVVEQVRECNINLPDVGCILEAPRASIIYHFDSGLQVFCAGRLRVTFNHQSKIELFEFTTTKHVEYIPRGFVLAENEKHNDVDHCNATRANMKRSSFIPDSPVNEFGLTLSTMRCLEIAEVVGHMKDLISLDLTSNTGPIQTLANYGKTLRECQAETLQMSFAFDPLPEFIPLGLPIITPSNSTNAAHNIHSRAAPPAAEPGSRPEQPTMNDQTARGTAKRRSEILETTADCNKKNKKNKGKQVSPRVDTTNSSSSRNGRKSGSCRRGRQKDDDDDYEEGD
ncbi:hypothetical protein SeMB42_g02893 [Synchytrium endobioticum]|uniref:LIM interaction domain-containing protein n=1 Tax=Synchytrium endobioticum TaxID=286115 RepID=A0A507CX37_9FUNG|nr:hypothetical protein SeLEV6574_g04896 [Synchytrium endobioticum]TPX48714.1 hypothetical protein SeMB42_g02893 [Synchytrium endobioticum]